MGFDFNPALEFVCKLCQSSFPCPSKLIEHKVGSHLEDCLKIKAIVFEEKFIYHNSDDARDLDIDVLQTKKEPGADALRRSDRLNPFVALTKLTKEEIKTVGSEKTDAQSSNLNLTAVNNQTPKRKNRGFLAFQNEIYLEAQATTAGVGCWSNKKRKVTETNEFSTASANKKFPSTFEARRRGNSNQLIITPVKCESEPAAEEDSSSFTSDFQIINVSGNYVEVKQDVQEFILEDDDEASFDGAESIQFNSTTFHQELNPFQYQQSSFEAFSENESELIDPLSEPGPGPGPVLHQSFTTRSSNHNQNHSQNHNHTNLPVRDQLQQMNEFLEIQPNPNDPSSSSDTVSRPYMCDICYGCFRLPHILARHKLTHSEDRPHTCTYCPLTFKYRDSLRRHLIESHGGRTRFQCRFCHKSFIGSREVRDHERIHTGEKPFICPIPHCSLAFTSNSGLITHKRAKHGEELGLQQFVCPLCGQVFGLKSFLNCHIKRKHRGYFKV